MQKDADEKEEKLKSKLKNNKKEKKLVAARMGRVDKYGNEIDDYDSYSEDSYGDEEYEEVRKN